MKILGWNVLYQRERDAYLRLQEYEIEKIVGCNVPALLPFDDELWGVEMTIVEPPYILDFAGAYVDIAPEYPPEVVEEWVAEKKEQFGDQWPEIRRIVFRMEQMGIYLTDVNPKNVRLTK